MLHASLGKSLLGFGLYLNVGIKRIYDTNLFDRYDDECQNSLKEFILMYKLIVNISYPLYILTLFCHLSNFVYVVCS